MELGNLKPLIILVFVMGIVVIALLIFNNINTGGNSRSNSGTNKTEIRYPNIDESAEEILSKIYNENRDYYSGFHNISGESENIFGNEKELNVSKLDQRTLMTIALNNFDLNDLEKISCSSIAWSSNWNDSCGSNSGNTAYSIPVGELNNKVEEIFNKRLDYSNVNLDDLTIGLCTGHSKDSYIFRYIKDKSIYVSVKRNSSCINNGKLEVTNVSKNQSGDLLTLIVSYSKTPVNYLGSRASYGEIKSYQDKIYFKVKQDKTYYYFASSASKLLSN